MSDDPKFDELLRREAKGYRSTGEPPAAAMWSRIERDVAEAIRRPPRRRVTWLAVGAGIAAALVIGVAIGRRSMSTAVPRSAAPSAIATSAGTSRDARLRAATVNHLVQAEIFLTEVRADLSTGRQDPERGERSRHLLARTRLLLANDAADAPTLERLLQDLELVLAEIAALPDSGGGHSIDTRLLDERLRAGTVLPRIRTIVPPDWRL